MIDERVLTPRARPEEDEAEAEQGLRVRSLRPRHFGEFIGQEGFQDKIQIFLEAAKTRREALDHVLLCGPPGLGKTTMSKLIAGALGSDLVETSGPALERAGDLAAILSNLSEGDVLFIDEIHRLPRVVEETVYVAMEDFAIDIVLGKGPAARSLRLDLPPFTLIGATTRSGLLSAPFRSRFGIVHNFEFYRGQELAQIVRLVAQKLDLILEGKSDQEIAKRARGTPRIAIRLLKRVRDFAVVKADGVVRPELCAEALEVLGVDELGLDVTDRRLLTILAEAPHALGLKTLAVSLGEEPDTVEDVLEPFLILSGLLVRTPKGRMITPKARLHLGLPGPESEALLSVLPGV